MSVFGALDVSATGMTAQQLRMDTISENIANVNTTRAKDGKPYKRKTVLLRRKVIRVLVKVLAWQTVIILEKVLRQVK